MNLDPSSWPAVTWLAAAIALLLGLGIGTLLTRRSKGVARVRALERDLEASREELAAYREQVSGHFTETGKHLRDLALQYRTVYDHLSEGARTLCPEAAVPLESGLGMTELAEHSERPIESTAEAFAADGNGRGSTTGDASDEPLVEALSEQAQVAESDDPFPQTETANGEVAQQDEVKSDTVS